MGNELYSVVPFKGSDGLTHWKYVRREKKNGKWRYYYDTKKLKEDAKDVVSDIGYEIDSALRDTKEHFEWGYEKGSKKDPNTGNVLNRKNIDPDVYRNLARTTERYRENLNTPWYRGESEARIKSDQRLVKDLGKEIRKLHRDAAAAESFSGKLGQVAGRTVTKSSYIINKGKKRVEEILNRR